MKNIFLICPAELNQMPYVQSYISVISELSLSYQLIIWDRNNNLTDHESDYIYRDNKTSLRRGFIDYYKFSIFYKNIISSKNENIVIAFGIPVLFFMDLDFVKKNNVVADIRDYHLLCKFYPSFKKVLNNTLLNVISSSGFRKWLPCSTRYLVNHNTSFSSEKLEDIYPSDNRPETTLSCIGALKDFGVLKTLLNEANVRKELSLVFNFHGEGIINLKLEQIRKTLPNVNIKITGRYLKSEEKYLYGISDWINMFMTTSNINNATCLSNRLYNSVYYGKPLVCYEGSFLADLIKKYSLGIVFKDVNDFFDNFRSKSDSFNYKLYNAGRRTFFESVDMDNRIFKESIKALLVEN